MPTPKKGPRFGRDPAHQRLIMANMASSLFEAGYLVTTVAKAKALRPYAEHLITKAKVGGVHQRRQVIAVRLGAGHHHSSRTDLPGEQAGRVQRLAVDVLGMRGERERQAADERREPGDRRGAVAEVRVQVAHPGIVEHTIGDGDRLQQLLHVDLARPRHDAVARTDRLRRCRRGCAEHAKRPAAQGSVDAGNSADKQFIIGSPAAASSALSVAQTEVPSATLQLMTLLAPVTGDRGAVFQPWAQPLSTTIEGPVYYTTAAGKRIGCADADGNTPYAPGELAGKIVLVDRGTCSFSLKISNIAAAGGKLGIIGLVTPDAPFGGSFGGCLGPSTSPPRAP